MEALLLFQMSVPMIVAIVLLVLMAAAAVVLYFLGKNDSIIYGFSPLIVIVYLIPCIIIFYLGMKRYTSVGS